MSNRAERAASGARIPAGPVGVMLLVSDLEAGGAQRQVVQLARNLDRDRFEPVVCSLSERVFLADGLRDWDRELVIVNKRWRLDATTVFGVARIMKERGIAIVHAFLFDAEMVARLAARLAHVPVVLGSERNADYRRPGIHSVCLRLTQGLCDAVIANSRAGKRFTMRTLGIPEDHIHVVPNGVDVTRFRPFDGSESRRRLGIGVQEAVVGMVAGFKPQKNHMMFLRMARQVLDRIPGTRFLLVGGQLQDRGEKMLSLKPGAGIHRNVGQYYKRVSEAIDQLGLRSRCVMVGERHDVADLYNACDVTVLTSRHEGTPNVLLESMACGVPVVATGVCDNASIVPDGQVGHVVALDDVTGMAERVCGLLSDEGKRTWMGAAARAWVEQKYSTTALARNTETIYTELLKEKRRTRTRIGPG